MSKRQFKMNLVERAAAENLEIGRTCRNLLHWFLIDEQFLSVAVHGVVVVNCRLHRDLQRLLLPDNTARGPLSKLRRSNPEIEKFSEVVNKLNFAGLQIINNEKFSCNI